MPSTIPASEDILHNVLLYLPFRDWFNVLISCKQLNRIGRIAFDPSHFFNYPIECASQSGKLSIVTHLLKDPRVDPSDNDNYSLRWAVKNGHSLVVVKLLKDERVLLNGFECLLDIVKESLTCNNDELAYSTYRLIRDTYGAAAIHSQLKDLLLLTSTKACTITLQEILQEDVDPSFQDNILLKETKSGAVAKILLKDPRIRLDHHIFSTRLANAVVTELLKDDRIDPSVNDYEIVRNNFNNSLDVLRALLKHPKVDPSANNNHLVKMALLSSAARCNMQELLLDTRVDPSVNDNEILRILCKNISKYELEIQWLLRDPRVDASIYEIEMQRHDMRG
jgi:hypothetical protein